MGVDFYSVSLTLPLDGGGGGSSRGGSGNGGAPNDAAAAAATLQLWDVGGGCSAAMAATYAAGADAVLLVHNLAAPAVSLHALYFVWRGDVFYAFTKRARGVCMPRGRHMLQALTTPRSTTHTNRQQKDPCRRRGLARYAAACV